MTTAPQLREEDLSHALREIVLHPERSLLPAWSWKAAGMSALLRAATFFATNLRAGRYDAVRAGLVEAVFAVFAAGLLGAISQRLRLAKPIWATALVVWLAMPLGMLLAQFGVHKLAHTPHLGTGLTVSFFFAASCVLVQLVRDAPWSAVGRRRKHQPGTRCAASAADHRELCIGGAESSAAEGK